MLYVVVKYVNDGQRLWLLIGNRTESAETSRDGGSDEDIIRQKPATASQNLNTVHPEAVPVLSNCRNIDVSTEMSGSMKPSSEDRTDWSKRNNTGDCQSPAVYHNSDRFSTGTDLPWTQSSCHDDTRKTGLADCSSHNYQHNGDCFEYVADEATFCSTPTAKSQGVYAQDVNRARSDLKSFDLSGNDSDSRTPSENDIDLQTSLKRNRLNNLQLSQKPVYDRSGCNGISVSRIADAESGNISTNDDDNCADGVVFNTSDFEVINAIKADGQLTNGLLEFGDILQWDVRSVDLSHKAQMIGDSEPKNYTLTGDTVCEDPDHSASMEPDSGVVFSSESRESSQLSDVVDRHLSQTRRSSDEMQTHVFSDISDDDDNDVATTDKETVSSCSPHAESSQILPKQDEIQFAASVGAANDARDNMQTDAANQYRNGIEYNDSCDNIVRQNSDGDKLEFSLQQSEEIYRDAFNEIVSHSDAAVNSLMNSESRNVSLTELADSTALPDSDCNMVNSSTEMLAKALARNTWNAERMSRRRRNKFGDKTILGVVGKLLETFGAAADCSGEHMELEPDVCGNQDMDKAIEEIILTTLSSELPALCHDGQPGSPMDEAPPLLAITDLLEDDDVTNGTEPTESKKRAASSGVGYDSSDDFEAAMPIIEDMRSILPTENELRLDEEENSGAKSARRARKASKPLKRKIPAAGRKTLEIERTWSLSFGCDQCTFTCGAEHVLHQHVKTCHRTSARGEQRARYACTDCPATADDRETFLDHLSHHPGQHSVRYFICLHCDADAADMAAMEQHVAASHTGAVLRFQVVQQRVNYLDSLMNCPLCGAASRWKKNFVDHIRTYHRMQQLAEYLERGHHDRERCPEKLSVHRNDVIGHAGTSGMDAGNQSGVSRYRDLTPSFNSSLSVVVHICCRCTFSTDDIDSYLVHYREHFSTSAPARTPRATVIAGRENQPLIAVGQRLIETPKGKGGGGSYACHLCPFKTPKRMFYQRHMAIHERNTGMTDGYRCGYCQFAHPRIQCVKFHLGKYHNNRPIKVVRISGGVESEIVDDGQYNNYEDDTANSYPAARSSTITRSSSQLQVASSYDSCEDSVSSFSSAATSSKSVLPAAVNQKARELANDRLRRLNDFERRLSASMFYEERVKCPLCSFADAVRINLLRHLRTHRNDEEQELKNLPPPDDVCNGFAVAQSVQNETLEAGRYTRPAMETTAVNMHNTSSWSIPTTPQLQTESHLVNISIFIILMVKC